MPNIIKLIENFNDRITSPAEYIPVDPRVLAEQRLAIRTACFKSNAEIKAYCEGLNCPLVEYYDIKRRYRVMARDFKQLTKAQQRKLLIAANIDPKVALYERN
jgi:hypothetical protein